MALKEQTIQDKIEIVGVFKSLQIRQDKQIVDEDTGDIKANGQWHRYVLNPGDDISGQPSEVQAVANAVWTDEIKSAYTAHLDAIRP